MRFAHRFGGAVTIAAISLTGVGISGAVLAAPAHAATSCVSSDRVKIKLGMRGINSIKEAQCRLNMVGYDLTVDGVFGSGTEKAVKSFQDKHNLTPDGVVGTKTWAALVAATGGTSSRDQKVATVVSYAKKQLGKPYKLGATGPSSFDCSGLTQSAYKQVGITIARKSTQQHVGYTEVSAANRKTGDLIWWSTKTHVGLYVGGGHIIDASGSQHKVVERNVYVYDGHPARYFRIIK
ncbi:C40 family peptidase [Flexivirga sp. B27]